MHACRTLEADPEDDYALDCGRLLLGISFDLFQPPPQKERERDNVINAEMKQYLRKYLSEKCKSHDLWPFHMLYIKSLGHNLKAIKQMIYTTTF